MANEKPEFKFLEHCAPSELIRFNLDDHTEWALVGKPGNGLFPVLVLSGNNAPYCFNAAADQGSNLKIQFLQRALFSYGQSYSLEPDHAGPCHVYSGELFVANGAMVITGPATAGNTPLVVATGGQFLRAQFKDRAQAYFFDLKNGRLSGEPEGNFKRAAFGKWTLRLHESVTGREDGMSVIEFSASPAIAHS